MQLRPRVASASHVPWTKPGVVFIIPAMKSSSLSCYASRPGTMSIWKTTACIVCLPRLSGAAITRETTSGRHRQNYSAGTHLLPAHQGGDLAAVGEAQLVEDVLDVV